MRDCSVLERKGEMSYVFAGLRVTYSQIFLAFFPSRHGWTTFSAIRSWMRCKLADVLIDDRKSLYVAQRYSF